MKPSAIIFSLFGQDKLAKTLQENCSYEMGHLNLHEFPDEEVVVTFNTPIQHRKVIFIVNLVNPNSKLLPLLFAAETARSLGATQVLLIAPYLPYMRQDKVFEQGQGITSSYFAKLISTYFDGLITFDPHLHRWPKLDLIYTIPSYVLHAENNIASWIKNKIQHPVLIGPDKESKQWVENIAKKADAPFIILEKQRRGDKEVSSTLPIAPYLNDKTTPVLVDDIISSGMTMIETVRHLRSLNMPPPVCIGIHAVFAGDAYQQMLAENIASLVTCNTIPHASNTIDLSQLLVDFLQKIG